MAKKKKPKIDTKTLKAQHKNSYIKKLEEVYFGIHPDLFPNLTKKQREILYLSRGTKINATSDQKLPGWFADHLDQFIKYELNHIKVEVIPDKLYVSCLEFSIYLFPILAWAEQWSEQFTAHPWFKEIFLDNGRKIMGRYNDKMELVSSILMYDLSNYRYTLVYIDYKIFLDNWSDGMPRINQSFKVKGHSPQWYEIKFNNNQKRSGIELVYNIPKIYNVDEIEPFAPVTLTPKQLGMKAENPDKPLPVIIQRHALNRLNERIGCACIGFMEDAISMSIQQCEIHYTPNKQMLIAYYLIDLKLGYFMVDYDEDVVFIRTFLFITNASTPEGEKIREHTGLQKEDIKFFNMDKLPSILESDIINDERMIKILKDTGCESILKLPEIADKSNMWKLPEEKKKIAERLNKYMMEDTTEPEED